jgi:hypothetical protein
MTTYEGSEPIGLAPDGHTVIDGNGRVVGDLATSGGGDIVVSAVDPGAIGAGKVWMDTSGNDGLAMMFKVRSTDDAQWMTVFGFDPPAAGLAPAYLFYGMNVDTGPDPIQGSSVALATTNPNEGIGLSLTGLGQAFSVFASGELHLGDTSTNQNLLVVIPGGGDNLFTFYDGAGHEIFAIDADGDLHGKTGKALTFDL